MLHLDLTISNILFACSGAVRRWSDAEVYAYLSHRKWRLAYYKSREQTKGVDLSYMGHGYLGCRKFLGCRRLVGCGRELVGLPAPPLTAIKFQIIVDVL